MEENWITLEEYSEFTGLDITSVKDLVDRNKLRSKVQGHQIFIDPTKNTQAVVPAQISELAANNGLINVNSQFVENAIGTIINLHEKVLGAKDETIESVKSENQFLKEALASLQELYEEDRKTIDTLTKQLKHAQDEVEFLRRKYKLMWGKVVEDYAKPA